MFKNLRETLINLKTKLIDDPNQAKVYRESLEVAKGWNVPPNREVFIFFTHQWGGGIERHINDLTTLINAAGGILFLCQPSPLGHLEIRKVQDHDERVCVIDPDWEATQLAEIFKTIRVTHIHVHSLAMFQERTSDLILEVCALTDTRFDITLHDYIPVCPRIHLMDENGMYCGEPDLAGCEQCLVRNGSHFGHVSVEKWRERYKRLLFAARTVFAPNIDVLERYKRYFPQLDITLKPHDALAVKPVRVALIGSLPAHKGSRVVAAVAKAAKRASLPLRFIVIGKTDDDEGFSALGNVQVMGPYQDQDLQGLLRQVKPDMVWFASTWPETYSYTLSAAFEAGLPCIAFDMGAIAQRISERGSGHLIAWNKVNSPDAIVQELLTCAGDPLAHSATTLSDYYGIKGDGSSRRFFQ